MKKSQLVSFREEIKTCGGSRTLFRAYAFIRGVPYRVIEPVTRPQTGYAAESALKWAAEHIYDSLLHYAPAEWPRPAAGPDVAAFKKSIIEWMMVPESEERRAKRESARAAWIARRKAHAAEMIAKRGAA